VLPLSAGLGLSLLLPTRWCLVGSELCLRQEVFSQTTLTPPTQYWSTTSSSFQKLARIRAILRIIKRDAKLLGSPHLFTAQILYTQLLRRTCQLL